MYVVKRLLSIVVLAALCINTYASYGVRFYVPDGSFVGVFCKWQDPDWKSHLSNSYGPTEWCLYSGSVKKKDWKKIVETGEDFQFHLKNISRGCVTHVKTKEPDFNKPDCVGNMGMYFIYIDKSKITNVDVWD